MTYSVISSKGQTTIPKEIRDVLGLQAKDKVVYYVEPKTHNVILSSISGNILDLDGIFSKKENKAIDFKKQRKQVLNKVLNPNIDIESK